MIEVVSTFTDCLASLAFEAGKERFDNKVDEKKLRSAFKSFIERQTKYNETCAMAEEIDFEGLVEYLEQSFLDDVRNRAFAISRKEREEAYQNIMSAAKAYAKANSIPAERRVAKIVSNCINIIYHFYRSKKDYAESIIAMDTVDAITEIIDEAKAEIVSTVKENKGSPFSTENLLEEACSGDIEVVSDRISTILRSMSIRHPLYPDYGYTMQDDVRVSKPLTADAIIKYPPRFAFRGAMRAGDKFFNDPNINPLDYAYRHQVELVMEISEAKKLLGTQDDPSQHEAERLIGKELHIAPPEFPPAIPCSLIIDGKTYYEYILVRTQELLDEISVFGNKEQANCTFYVEFRVPKIIPVFDDDADEQAGLLPIARSELKFSISDANHKETLQYLRFLQALEIHKQLCVHVLGSDHDLFRTTVDINANSSDYMPIEEEIDFLERVCDIENYYNVSMNAQGEISVYEHNTVVFLSNLIRNDEVKKQWHSVAFTGAVDDQFRNSLLNLGDESFMISYTATSKVELLGTSFEIQYKRTYNDTVLVDRDRKKKIVSLLANGELIELVFQPGKDNTQVDTIKIP